MFRSSRLIVPFAATGLLAACSIGADQKLAQLDATTADSDAFASTLFTEYGGYARAEFAEFDFADSRFFSDRALTSARGEIPNPQNLAGRNIPEQHTRALSDARGRLVTALSGGAITAVPQAAAEAQAAYDCWLQEAEENIQPDDIAACRARFEAAMSVVDEAMGAEQVATAAPGASVFIVYFDFNSAEINNAAQSVIDTASQQAVTASTVQIAGHADAAGANTYNLALSERRARSVRGALEAAGVGGGKIETTSLGETELAIKTDQKEAANRRAVIMLVP